MRLPTSRWGVYAVSARRPGNVTRLQTLLREQVTWVVPADNADAYAKAGAHALLPVPDPDTGWPLPTARNAALADAAARGVACIQTSDDLRRLLVLDASAHRGAVPAPWAVVRTMLLDALDATGAFHAGLPPTANPFFASDGIKTCAYVIGDLTVDLDPDVGWDTGMALKEDYDHTCRHLSVHGKVARVGGALADYLHYRNPGGAVAYRSEALEAAMRQTLLDRWPDWLHPHPRRHLEVVLKEPRHAGLRNA